jgi:hypothetical protein
LSKVESRCDAIVAAKAAHVTLLKKRIAKLEASHAAAVAKLEATHARTVAVSDAASSDLRTAIAKLDREHAVLNAETAPQLAAVHAAVTSNLALELHPIRHDRRQFAMLHAGPVPCDDPPSMFDTAWCAAACGDKWKVDIDPLTHTRARTKEHSDSYLTLRGATPLPRRVPSTGGPLDRLPWYRVVIAAYHDSKYQDCNVGFVPSHTSTDGAAVTPVVGYYIHQYGGWWFRVKAAATNKVEISSRCGWTVLPPCAAPVADTSAYATTAEVPPVPAGSAVELAVDYAAGTCRVAFYTPAAVAGGFVEAPYAKMELRFVATAAADGVPARLVPTAAPDSCVQLFPAVCSTWAGTDWRFV